MMKLFDTICCELIHTVFVKELVLVFTNITKRFVHMCAYRKYVVTA